MPKIVKTQAWWKVSFNIFFSIMWFAVAVIHFIASNYFLGILYSILTLSYISFHYYNKKKGRGHEFIEWDERVVTIGRIGTKPLYYYLDEIENITVTSNDLIIKSGAAKGTMVELKGFESDDLDLLKARFGALQTA